MRIALMVIRLIVKVPYYFFQIWWCGKSKKRTFEEYPLHVEYSLTSDRGEEILKALKIMQHIGIDY